MKNFYLFFLFLVLVNNTSAQISGIISTDPNNPINEERPEFVNTFNWMENQFYFHNGYTIESPYINPFFQFNNPHLKHLNYYDTQSFNPDFHPKDGWELLFVDFGYDQEGEEIDANNLSNGPVYALYNKYSAHIRGFVGVNLMGNSANFNKISFSHYYNNNNGSINSSGLFNLYGNREYVNTLDMKTNINSVSSSRRTYGIDEQWMSGDVNVFYDPCNCYYKSELRFNADLISEGTINLEGRMVGTFQEATSDNATPLFNSENFLLSVAEEGFTINGGSTMFDNINNLDQYLPGNTNSNDFFQTLFTGAITGVGTYLDSKLPIPIVDEDDSFNLGVFSSITRHFTSRLFNNNETRPSVGVIESELKLTGNLTMGQDLVRKRLKEPGSLNSNNSDFLQYPTYNKPLGLFSVLRKPKVFFESRGNYGSELDTDLNLYTVRNNSANLYRFGGVLDYVFNSSVDINIEESNIYGALHFVVETSHELPYTDNTSYFPGSTLPTLNVELIDGLNEENNGVLYFSTPIMPIEYLSEYPVQILDFYSLFIEDKETGNVIQETFKDSEITAYLKVLVEYKFEENTYGETNTSLQNYTFPVELVDSNDDFVNLDHNGFPEQIEETYITSSAEFLPMNPFESKLIKAWDKSTIQHLVQPNIDANLLIKSKEVVLKEGAVVKPGTTIKAGMPYWDREELPQVSSSEVNNFCNSSEYQARFSEDGVFSENQKLMTTFSDTNFEEDNFVDLSLFPNPTNGKFNVTLDKLSSGTYEIYDINGRLITKDNFNDSQIIDINLQDQSNGIYIVRINNGNEFITHKVIKQ